MKNRKANLIKNHSFKKSWVKIPQTAVQAPRFNRYQRIPAKTKSNRKIPKCIIFEWQKPKIETKYWNYSNKKETNIQKKTHKTHNKSNKSDSKCKKKKVGYYIKKKKEYSEMYTSPRVCYSARLLFRFEGMMQNFMNRKQLSEFIALKSTLHKAFCKSSFKR